MSPYRWCLLLSMIFLAGSCATQRTGSSTRRRQPQPKKRFEITKIVKVFASRHEVPEDLVLGVIAVESSFRVDATSRVGARGLMQLMPRTAASIANRIGRDYSDIEDIITDPSFNIEAGTYYLSYLIKRFGSVKLALAAYNAGPARVQKWKRTGRPLPQYSQRYVAAVTAARQQFTKDPAQIDLVEEPLDRQGLRALLKRSLYGDRPDEPLPES